MDQKVYKSNQLNDLKRQLSHIEPSKIFLVHGKGSYVASGAENFINSLLNTQVYTSFSDFEPNPQLHNLVKGIELFNKHKYELIIAIGGGSVLDMAKLISVFAHQNTSCEDIISGKAKIKNTKTPLLTIPTTAGTGAEATHFAVLYIGKNKYSIAHQAILPNQVYLSSEFSQSAAAYLTACTGLDAFCQAVESVWSVNSNAESEKYALEAIQLIWQNLAGAVERNAEAKEILQHAAYLAGKAINITKTTAPHAISYAFTSFYNIPHGHAVALSLPFFFTYNYELTESDCTDARGALQVKKRMEAMLEIFNCSPAAVEKTLINFFDKLNIHIKIRDLIEDFKPELIAENVNTERLNNNPRTVTGSAIMSLLK